MEGQIQPTSAPSNLGVVGTLRPSINELMEAVTALSQRLTPVLGPDVPTVATDKDTGGPSGSPAATEIFLIIRDLKVQVDRLAGIKDRVDI